MSLPRLILASASPRRRELLETAGWNILVEAAHVDESLLPGEAAKPYVGRLAREKALAVAHRHIGESALVLGADTTVAHQGEILGKPGDPEEARRMLRTLSGNIHHVHTGVCLIHTGGRFERWAVETTQVWFAPLSDVEIEAYIDSGEPFDKAGAYAIQGRAAQFIPRIEGSWSNVVGLPLHLVRAWLTEADAAMAAAQSRLE